MAWREPDLAQVARSLRQTFGVSPRNLAEGPWVEAGMIETLIAVRDEGAGTEDIGVGEHVWAPLAPDRSAESQREAWDRTDRPMHVAVRARFLPRVWDASSAATAQRKLARARWMLEHDVHTEFLDAGIGCCWFAQQGDDEPVCGETEDAALEQLAQQNGLHWESATHGA